jgi:hypothetical protein
MTRSEMIRLRRQMQRRIQEVVAERRSAANQRAAAGMDNEPQADKVA